VSNQVVGYKFLQLIRTDTTLDRSLREASVLFFLAMIIAFYPFTPGLLNCCWVMGELNPSRFGTELRRRRELTRDSDLKAFNWSPTELVEEGFLVRNSVGNRGPHSFKTVLDFRLYQWNNIVKIISIINIML